MKIIYRFPILVVAAAAAECTMNQYNIRTHDEVHYLHCCHDNSPTLVDSIPDFPVGSCCTGCA